MSLRQAISKAVPAAGKAQKAPAKLIRKHFKCPGGWAYADANLGTGAPPRGARGPGRATGGG
jgi:hypothetical protein